MTIKFIRYSPAEILLALLFGTFVITVFLLAITYT